LWPHLLLLWSRLVSNSRMGGCHIVRFTLSLGVIVALGIEEILEHEGYAILLYTSSD